MEYEIGITYREDIPNECITDLSRDLQSARTRVETERRENHPMMIIEWAVPAVIILFAKAYFDGFVKEIGKEHYLFIKERMKEFISKTAPVPQIAIASQHSPNKLSGTSRAFDEVSDRWTAADITHRQ
jgi:hypothetical protein